MLALIGSLWRNQRLLKDFVVRDLKARYVGSSMGFFWSVVFPIINLFVYMFVFRLVLKARWSDFQGPLEVALVMLAGIVVWAAFAETISRATNTLVDNSNLIQKVVFPSELLPLYLTVSSLINMCIGLPVVIACVLYFAYVSPPVVHVHVPHHLEEGAERETPIPQIAVEGGAPVAIPVLLSRGLNRDVSVPFALGGTATEGEDYYLDVAALPIPSGQLRVEVLVRAVADKVTEGEETVVFTLNAPDEAKLGNPVTQTVTLVDESPEGGADPDPSLPVVVAGAMDADYHPLAMGFSLICLPLLFGLQILFTVGLGYFLATLNLFLRDTYHLVGVAITVWMFGTPIFYPAEMVASAGYGLILQLNPMYWLIASYRAILLYAEWPDWLLLARFAAAGAAVFLAGGAFFMAQKRRFPDLL